ncbi:uncharacterized protein sfi1 [Synchiropus picturatus]
MDICPQTPAHVGLNDRHNVGGRLDELRIRNLARKFSKIWVHNTFGRILPHSARSHYNRVILRRAFEEWKEQWWTSRREWSLTIRANIHYRYYLCQVVFLRWKMFMSSQQEKRKKILMAEAYADKRRMCWVWKKWNVFAKKRRMKNKMLTSALELSRLTTMRAAWSLWKLKLQHHHMSALVDHGLEHRETKLLRMAMPLDEHQHTPCASLTWEQDMQPQDENFKSQTTSDCVYGHSETYERVTEASRHHELDCKKWALDSWKKFVQTRKLKKSRLAKMQLYYQTKLKRQSYVAWQNRHSHMSEIHLHAEKLDTPQTHSLPRGFVFEWRTNTVMLSEAPAQNCFQSRLQTKMFVAWREETAKDVLRRRRQSESLSRAQGSLSQVLLLHSFTKWRSEAFRAVQTRKFMENAKQQYQFKLLSKSLIGWKEYCCQRQKYRAMKRQGLLLLRLKMCQLYFDRWKMELQNRRRESAQTEQALWHWSLSLQAKVLFEWRRWTKDEQRQREQVSRAALVYRDQLLQEGVSRILTCAAHMSDFTVNLIQQSKQQHHSQGGKRIQSVVQRYAMKWKERALGKLHMEPASRKKNVTFSLQDVEVQSEESNGKEETLCDMVSSSILRRQPRRCPELFDCPQKRLQVDIHHPLHSLGGSFAQMPHPEVSLSSDASKENGSSSKQRDVPTALSPTEPYTLDHQVPQNNGLLLPPSAFMTSQMTLVRAGTSLCEDSADEHQATPCAETDVLSTLTEELTLILQEMKTYHQSRQQLRAWQQLTDILQSWLLTSGKEEEVERKTVCQELNQLGECIKKLSADLAGRKPQMILHADRIGRLRSLLRNKGFLFSHRSVKKAKEEKLKTQL